MTYADHKRISEIVEAIIECRNKMIEELKPYERLKQQIDQLGVITVDLITHLNEGTNELIKGNHNFLKQLDKEHKAHKEAPWVT